MNHDGLCDLCNARTTVRPSVVAWRVPVFGRYENVDRCTDEEACRARVQALGDPWPVMDTGERLVEGTRP